MSLRAIALLGCTAMQGGSTDSPAIPPDRTSAPSVTVAVAQTPRPATAGFLTREAPFVIRPQRSGAHARSNSARQGWLLRSNSALGLARVDGVPRESAEHDALGRVRFATTNHVSIGYGWRPNWALTLDGFRLVVPHYPHPGDEPVFAMRVDTESLGLGLGSSVYIVPWSLHLGTSLGFAMSRVAGDLLHAPTHRGLGSLSFAGFELMRSQKIGVVLSAQVIGIVARHRADWMTTRTYALALGVTYW